MINKLLSICLVLLIVVIGIIVFQTGFQYDDPRYKIYYSHAEDISINALLGIIPSSYLEEYDEHILEASYQYSLLNVVSLQIPFYSNDIIYINRGENSRQILKGYPPKILPSKPSYDSYQEHVAHQIDIEVFNRYIDCREKFEGKLNREDVINRFTYLLSIPDDSTSYQRIYNKSDLLRLTEKWPPNDSNYQLFDEEDFIDIENFEIQNKENEVYYWYFFKGVVWFDFDFEQGTNRLLKVDSKVLGYLGNEHQTCC